VFHDEAIVRVEGDGHVVGRGWSGYDGEQNEKAK